jgi:phospholipid/cholesterol/gamma-HCH transport system substrate-binding protein
MLTRATRVKLMAFAAIGVLIIAFTGLHYADLGRYLGIRGYYVVKLDLADGGGLYPNADVTYRGVSVGRVGTLQLTATGVQADLDISSSAPPIPARLHAAVADLSAVGEQYVDLRPQVTAGPYLTEGSVIPERDTSLPLPVTSLLTSINSFATSVPLGTMRKLIDELGTGFSGEGANLAALINGNASLTHAADETLPQTKSLILDGRTVLATQIDETSELEDFGKEALLLAKQIAGSNTSLEQLISDGPQAAGQLADLLAGTNPSLSILIANLLTTANLTITRGQALDELLSALPAAISIGSTVITSKGARFGVTLTFFNPLPCEAGYGGTVYRNGLDTSPAPPLNTGASCTLPASSGVDVRGSAHAPSEGVPPAVQPGLAQLLGVNP